MKFLKAVLCLVASVAFPIAILLVLNTGEKAASAPSFGERLVVAAAIAWVPFWCWLLVFLPLVFVKATLSRWPWYVAGPCGAAAGIIVLALTIALLAAEHHERASFWVMMALSVALQFTMGNLFISSSRGGKAKPEDSTVPAG